MKEYSKIETIYDRDEKTHKVIVGKWRMPEFAYLANCEWVFTEKVNGTNVRIGWNGGDIEFGGKTDDSQISSLLVKKLTETFRPLTQTLQEKFGEAAVTFYGEGYGAKIQKEGKNYTPDAVDFVLFDVLVGIWWLERHNVEDVAQALGLRVVPIVGRGTLEDATVFCREGFSSTWGNFPAEGVVLRPAVELQTRGGERIIGKLKHRDF